MGSEMCIRDRERACREHMGLIWLTGMNAPDHNSLWRFMDSNCEALSELFKHSARVAAKCKLVGMVLNALDGTKIRSASSGERVVSSEDLEKRLERLETPPTEDPGSLVRAETSPPGRS